jgi:transglutaminase-like putative cysteine protease
MSHSVYRRPALVLFAVCLTAGAGWAQRAGRVLHRPIPGDVPLDENPSALPTVPPSSSQALARGAGPQAAWREHQGVDNDVQRPRPTWDAPAREMDRTTRSAPNTRLEYREVFTPSVQPFKRGTAQDMADELGRLTVRDPSLRPVAVGAPAPPSWAGHRRARFVGEMLVELSTSWPTPVPGIAGEQRIIRYAASDGESVEFLEDGVGNLFVRGVRSGTVRLTYLIESPDFAFAATDVPSMRTSELAARVPETLKPTTPSWLEARAQRVLSRIGVQPDWPFDRVLSRLVGHFRAFRDAELEGQGADLYTELALGGVGACRHRAYAMMLTMQALGIPARYVGNEAHAWVELWIHGTGWSRVDLGGWDVPLDTRAPSERPRFDPGLSDSFPRPQSYERQFSANGTGSGTGAARDGGAWLDPDASLNEPWEQSDSVARADGGGASRSGGASSGGAGSEASSAAASRAERAANERSDPMADDAPKSPTITSVVSVVADERSGFASGSGFARGSMVHIVGFVRDSDGVGISGLAVELQIVRSGRAAQSLGSAATGAEGRFEAHVLLGGALEPGDYTLRAATPGDTRYAGSVAD